MYIDREILGLFAVMDGRKCEGLHSPGLPARLASLLKRCAQPVRQSESLLASVQDFPWFYVWSTDPYAYSLPYLQSTQEKHV
jgi:hypothetical protein